MMGWHRGKSNDAAHMALVKHNLCGTHGDADCSEAFPQHWPRLSSYERRAEWLKFASDGVCPSIHGNLLQRSCSTGNQELRSLTATYLRIYIASKMSFWGVVGVRHVGLLRASRSPSQSESTPIIYLR